MTDTLIDIDDFLNYGLWSQDVDAHKQVTTNWTWSKFNRKMGLKHYSDNCYIIIDKNRFLQAAIKYGIIFTKAVSIEV